MAGIASRRFGKRTVADIEIRPRHAFISHVRQDNGVVQSPDGESESDSGDDGLPSPESPLSPVSPTAALLIPSVPPTISLGLPQPAVDTTLRLSAPPAGPTPDLAPPPPPPPITTATLTPTAAPAAPAPTGNPLPDQGRPITTLTPIAPPRTTVGVPARASGDSSTDVASPTTTSPSPTPSAGGPTITLTPIAPPRTTATESSTSTLASPTTPTSPSTSDSASPTSSTSTQASTTTTDTTTTASFIISTTSSVNGVPTTLPATIPAVSSATTFSTRTSSSTTRRTSTTTGASFTPIESAAPFISATPDSTPGISIEGTRSQSIGVGGVAALSIVIALASIATIVFVVYKCCWPQRLKNRVSSGSAGFGPIRKFWEKPRSAVRGGAAGGDNILPTHAQPDMAHVRSGEKIMDQVMAAAYEAEQGNAGVYGRYADRHRASWHTDDSAIIEEKQRQYEAAVAASAINGTRPPSMFKGRAQQLGQMMGAFLKDKHERPGPAEADIVPHSPAGTTSGPTAFMPKGHQVEWSWRVSVRRASQNLRGEDGWWAKAAKGFK